MKKKISIHDFQFMPSGHGHYKVQYENSRFRWTATISDMTIIDATRNSESPKRCDLEELRGKVIRDGSRVSVNERNRIPSILGRHRW